MPDPIELEMIEGRQPKRPIGLSLLAIGIEALTSRALVWVVTMGAGALWGLVMMEPTTLKIVTAVGYCVTVLGPILYRDGKG